MTATSASLIALISWLALSGFSYLRGNKRMEGLVLHNVVRWTHQWLVFTDKLDDGNIDGQSLVYLRMDLSG